MPYSLIEAKINAIWLAENQATGNIKLQPDFDENLQKDVLSCYLLPQQNFQTPSMENLLQGSAVTEVLSQNETVSDNFSDSHEKQTNKQPESVRFAADSDNDDKLVNMILK